MLSRGAKATLKVAANAVSALEASQIAASATSSRCLASRASTPSSNVVCSRRFSSNSSGYEEASSSSSVRRISLAAILAAGLGTILLSSSLANADENPRLKNHAFPGEREIDLELYRQGSLVHHSGVTAHIAGNLDDSEVKHRAALALRSQDGTPDGAYDLAQTLGSLSGTLLRAGKFDDSMPVTEQAVEAYEVVMDVCHADMATLSQMLKEAGAHLTGPLPDAKPIVPAWIGNPNYHNEDESTPSLAPSSASTGANVLPRHKPGAKLSDLNVLMKGCELFNEAVRLSKAGKDDEAEKVFAKVVEIRKVEFEDDDWYEVAKALAARSRCLLKLGRWNDAYAVASEAKAVYKSVVDAMCANVSGFLVYLADIHSKKGMLDRAQKDMSEALRYIKYIPGQPMLAYTLFKCGQIAEQRGATSEAIGYFENAWTNLQPRVRNSPRAADLSNQIGCQYIERANSLAAENSRSKQARDDYLSALEWLNRSLGLYREFLGDQHIETATVFSNMGEAAYGLDDFETSFRFHEAARSVRQQELGPRHPFVALSLYSMGRSRLSAGRYTEAKRLFTQSASALGMEIDVSKLTQEQIEDMGAFDHTGLIPQLLAGLKFTEEAIQATLAAAAAKAQAKQ